MERISVLSLNYDLDILMYGIELDFSREVENAKELYNDVSELLIKYEHSRIISGTSQVEYRLHIGTKCLSIRLDVIALRRTRKHEINYQLNIYENNKFREGFAVEDLEIDKVSLMRLLNDFVKDNRMITKSARK